MMSPNLYDEQAQAVKTIFNIYTSIGSKPPPKQFTVLSSFYLTRPPWPAHGDQLGNTEESIKVISLATGTKCMPAIKYSQRGELVHDSHAEVLARRGAARWFLEEIKRMRTIPGFVSEWLIRTSSGSLENSDGEPSYGLQDGVGLNMYVSTLPCGDASMRYLASIQDASMAALKSQNAFPTLAHYEASRGRDNYNRLGILRTKPGRADSPPALSMSCSDKMAKWTVLGIQGSLGARFLKPTYLKSIIVGEVPVEEGMRKVVREDCDRALRERVATVEGLPEGYAIHPPEIYFTDLPFIHSKTELDKIARTTGSCNESLCWVADSANSEVLINGLRRNTSPKNRYIEKYRPLLSRISMFNLYNQILDLEGLPLIPNVESYSSAKAISVRYQSAKAALLGPSGLFCGWVKIELRYQDFTLNGDYKEMVQSTTQRMGEPTTHSDDIK